MGQRIDQIDNSAITTMNVALCNSTDNYHYIVKDIDIHFKPIYFLLF